MDYRKYRSELNLELDSATRDELIPSLGARKNQLDRIRKNSVDFIGYLESAALISEGNVQNFLDRIDKADLESLKNIRQLTARYQLDSLSVASDPIQEYDNLQARSTPFFKVIAKREQDEQMILDILEERAKARYRSTEDRMDYYEIPEASPMFNNANGVCVFCDISDVQDNKDGTSSLNPATLQQSMNVVASEPFAQQPCPGVGSGFLVAKSLVYTAGHVMDEFKDIERCKVIFGFRQTSGQMDSTKVSNDNIYSVKVVKSQVVNGDIDYAVVELDREVSKFAPVKLGTSNVAKNTEVYMIGHPCGLPLKATGNAKVPAVYINSFTTFLTSYHGNSGSPVFHASTHEVVGILIAGHGDWELANGKNKSAVHKTLLKHIIGERCCHISIVKL